MQIRWKLTNLRVPGFRFFYPPVAPPSPLSPIYSPHSPASLVACGAAASSPNSPPRPLSCPHHHVPHTHPMPRSLHFLPSRLPLPFRPYILLSFSGEKPLQKLAKMHNGCILKAQVNLHLFFTFIFSGGIYEKIFSGTGSVFGIWSI